MGEISSGENDNEVNSNSSNEVSATSDAGNETYTGSESFVGNDTEVSTTGVESIVGKESNPAEIHGNNSEVRHTSDEITVHYQTTSGWNQMMETPETLEQAQTSVENYHAQSIQQILETNGRYMSEADRSRVEQGVNRIKAVEHNPSRGCTGLYLYSNGKSSMEVSAINQQQMERSTKHETNHFASKNREIIVPQPDRKGYTVYQTVGTRQASWFYSNETGKDSEFTSKGRGLNEGLTTMYTNQQLMELSREKGEAAERQGIYSHATELCTQLEAIVGKDTLKEAYYGGNIQNLEKSVNSLAGDKAFETFRDCLDRTISRDYAERVQAMKEAQSILAKMYEKGGQKI